MRAFLLLTAAFAPLLLQDEAKQAPTPPRAGAQAPAFRLNDHTGKAVTVGGKSESWTVLAFFPKAATPG